MLCDDPKCYCHPHPPRPFQQLEVTLRGSKPEEFCRLHGPGRQLDVVFNLIENKVTLQETVKDPNFRKASYKICMVVDTKDLRFVNLKGLQDSSLLLSFRFRSSACVEEGNKMTYREKYTGFSPTPPDSKLYKNLYLSDWPQKHLELLLPRDRIKGWKTVALILKTFKQISAENFCHIVDLDLRKIPPVAGLDWRDIEKTVMPDKDESSPESTPEKEKRFEFLFDRKKGKHSPEKQAISVRFE